MLDFFCCSRVLASIWSKFIFFSTSLAWARVDFSSLPVAGWAEAAELLAREIVAFFVPFLSDRLAAFASKSATVQSPNLPPTLTHEVLPLTGSASANFEAEPAEMRPRKIGRLSAASANEARRGNRTKRERMGFMEG